MHIVKAIYIIYIKEGVSKITTEVDNQYWTIVVTDDMTTLITVRRAHEDEVQDAEEN